MALASGAPLVGTLPTGTVLPLPVAAVIGVPFMTVAMPELMAEELVVRMFLASPPGEANVAGDVGDVVVDRLGLSESECCL